MTPQEDPATTPKQAGMSMPPEWTPHAATLMSWPLEREYWEGRTLEARREWAGVANAIADFETVIMVCSPGDEDSARNLCGGGVEILSIPIDDSWMRDNGPIFVRDETGRVGVVKFPFNAWGGKFDTYANDDAIPYRIAEYLGMKTFTAPFILEGGSIFVDGEGTLLTTEACLLHPNRNPSMTKEQIEEGLREYLGVDKIVWLPHGMAQDTGPLGTDGHVDGVAHYLSPGRVMLLAPRDPSDPDHEPGQANLRRLKEERDAKGREFDVVHLDVGAGARLSYANLYVGNGVVIVPTAGDERDADAIAQVSALFPDRETIGVPGLLINAGGGGPHCITQQVPTGPPA